MRCMIVIPIPEYFYCESDEDRFFVWLKGIPGVKGVVGTPQGLEVDIKKPIDKFSFYELTGLMRRYGLAMECLKPLCEGQEDPWFRDPTNKWYNFVYK